MKKSMTELKKSSDKIISYASYLQDLLFENDKSFSRNIENSFENVLAITPQETLVNHI